MYLVIFFTVLGWFINQGVTTEKDKAKARIIQTRAEERLMAEMLAEQSIKVGGMTNLTKEFVLTALRTTNQQFSFAIRTNNSNDVIDIWQTPFRIEAVGATNFMISSAGPNHKFGDGDDIVFNGASNDFVKP